jgi:hypothetical protein
MIASRFGMWGGGAMEKKKPVFKEQNRRIGCWGQVLGAILALAAFYWIFLAPINSTATANAPLTSIDNMRLAFRGTVNDLTGGYLDQVGEWFNRGNNVFVNFFQNITNRLSEMVQGTCGGLAPTVAAVIFLARRRRRTG